MADIFDSLVRMTLWFLDNTPIRCPRLLKPSILAAFALAALGGACHPKPGQDTEGSSVTGTTDTVTSSTSQASTTVSDTTGSSGPQPDLGEPELCGNGALDPGEACDDGNVEEGDGCESNCQIGPVEIWCRDMPGTSPRVEMAGDGEVVLALDIGVETTHVSKINTKTGDTIAEAIESIHRPSLAAGAGRVLLGNPLDTGPDKFVTLNMDLEEEFPAIGTSQVGALSASDKRILAMTFSLSGGWGVDMYGYDGSELWSDYYIDGSIGLNLTQDDTTSYVVGSDAQVFEGHGFIRRFNTSTGVPLEQWMVSMGDSSDLRGVAVDSMQRVHVVGVTRTGEDFTMIVGCFSPTGETLFLYELESESFADAYPQDLNAAGGLVTVPYSLLAEDLSKVGMRASDQEGSMYWNITREGNSPASTLGAEGDIYFAYQLSDKESRICRYEEVQ